MSALILGAGEALRVSVSGFRMLPLNSTPARPGSARDHRSFFNSEKIEAVALLAVLPSPFLQATGLGSGLSAGGGCLPCLTKLPA